ncbi:Cof-type HAD-IIB family hydrolase [Rossellomorea vietnamensis]|jgi:Cof subfamily protein (haloacid dehalogenase superfamily)|uniref:Cof-type HAD-IIB family hydrolase n=1 Tax=Rossellomorea vietnamensis TaxID=218284 RepID=A0A6I6UX65_9BACI|nr:Cof-type HAD-IIB family hydrolase [Rossellomorea vietnamensis]QHE63500.1 Cof-type HAD-IIB family hydrolase [Rossellomorea vietnamensis]
MITFIATDMDGTLLNEKQEISEANKQAILDAQEQGIEVVVATGRSYEEARYVIEEAGISCDIVCANGAEVRNKQGEIIYQAGIESARAREIAAVLNETGIYFEIYTDEGTYTENYEMGVELIVNIFTTANPGVSEEQVRQAARERFEKGHIKLVEDYGVLFSDDSQLVYKFLVFSFDDKQLQEANEKLSALTGIAISSSGKENIEVNSLEAQKGVALEKLLKDKGLSPQHAMAMGDNLNDLSMMKVVGRPVAMGNALDQIKDFCPFITATNKEDGVAKAIQEVIQQPAK